MPERVVVLGGGAAAQAFVAALRKLDPDVGITLVERELIGGECSYWACMPSKTLLRSPELVAAAKRAPGAAEALEGDLAADRVFWWRDQVVGDYDDSSQETWLKERRIELVRANGTVREPGVVVAAGRELPYDKLLIATGSDSAAPPIPGLDELDYWTNREATGAKEVPQSLIVIGGGAVGCELSQAYRRLGADVDLVHVSERLLPREDPEASALVAEAFREDGIAVHLCSDTEEIACARNGERFRVELPDVEPLEAERLLVATGRKPRVEGLEPLGLQIEKSGIKVDERMRAGENVWAIGDVCGVALFTHVGKYQGRVAAHDVAGKEAQADYRAIPAVVFTDPQVASAGDTTSEDLVTASRAVDKTSRTSTYERPKRSGFVKLFAKPDRRVLAGAVAVGPEAGEWLGQLTLAIRAEVPLDVLVDTIQPYPTFSEAIFFAARELAG
jgi:pyruvate/2-oxoglutarate dehydrogenase complex dihydrolipoamide dehydrogenase (E3) component